MKPLKPLVLGVTSHLKDLSIFGGPPYTIEAIRTAVRKLCDDIPIQFWAVDYQMGAIAPQISRRATGFSKTVTGSASSTTMMTMQGMDRR